MVGADLRSSHFDAMVRVPDGAGRGGICGALGGNSTLASTLLCHSYAGCAYIGNALDALPVLLPATSVMSYNCMPYEPWCLSTIILLCVVTLLELVPQHLPPAFIESVQLQLLTILRPRCEDVFVYNVCRVTGKEKLLRFVIGTPNAKYLGFLSSRLILNDSLTNSIHVGAHCTRTAQSVTLVRLQIHSYGRMQAGVPREALT
jgi:hypothetical protein